MTHANAPLTPEGRRRLARLVVEEGWPTPRESGSTGRRLCILNEPPPLVEYPQPSSSSTRTSCSRRPGQLPSPGSVSRMSM